MKSLFRYALTVLGLALAAVPTVAQEAHKNEVDPAVVALFAQAATAYHRLNSYAHSEVTSMSSDPTASDQKTTFQFAIAQPNRFRIRSDQDVADRLRITEAASDGTTFFVYRPQLGKYTRTSAPKLQDLDFDDLILPTADSTTLVAWLFRGELLSDPQWREKFSAAHIGPKATEGGKTYDTLVVESRKPNFQIQTTYYFDAASHLLHRSVTDGTGTISGHRLTLKATSVLTDVKVDSVLPTSLFAFTPPPAAQEVASFEDPQVLAAKKALIAQYEGKPAKDFAAKDRNGRLVSLSSLKGKVVIVDFWASWCVACKQVMPILQEVSETFADQGVVVLAVNTFDARADCDAFLQANPKYTMNILKDPAELKAEESIAGTLFGVHGIPTTLIIDREGTIHTYAIGAHERGYYLDSLKQLGIKIPEK